MKSLLVVFAAVAVAMAAGPRAQAQNYPWCAHYDKGDGGFNCGFTTFQQCLADISGLGGFCEQNNRYVPPAAPAHRQALKHRPRKAS